MVKHNCDYHDYMNKDGNEGGLKDKVYIHTYIHTCIHTFIHIKVCTASITVKTP